MVCGWHRYLRRLHTAAEGVWCLARYHETPEACRFSSVNAAIVGCVVAVAVFASSARLSDNVSTPVRMYVCSSYIARVPTLRVKNGTRIRTACPRKHANNCCQGATIFTTTARAATVTISVKVARSPPRPALSYPPSLSAAIASPVNLGTRDHSRKFLPHSAPTHRVW